MRYASLLLIFLLVAGCTAQPVPQTVVSPAPTASTAPLHTIVAFGDSLTAGYQLDERDAYPAQLERRLQHDGYRYQVVNAGNSGETSSGALTRINWVLRLRPEVVILETGANDGLRGVDPRLVQKNLIRLVQTLEAAHARVLLAGMQMVSNMGPTYTAAFKAIYPAVARQEKVPLIPFFLEGVAGRGDLTLADGLHPTAQGYSIIVDHIYPQVEALLQRPPHGQD